MKLRDAIKLKPGDVILCNACSCKNITVKIAYDPWLSDCRCKIIRHEGSIYTLVCSAKNCTQGHNHSWGVNVEGRDIKLISKKGE